MGLDEVHSPSFSVQLMESYFICWICKESLQNKNKI